MLWITAGQLLEEVGRSLFLPVDTNFTWCSVTSQKNKIPSSRISVIWVQKWYFAVMKQKEGLVFWNFAKLRTAIKISLNIRWQYPVLAVISRHISWYLITQIETNANIWF